MKTILEKNEKSSVKEMILVCVHFDLILNIKKLIKGCRSTVGTVGYYNLQVDDRNVVWY